MRAARPHGPDAPSTSTPLPTGLSRTSGTGPQSGSAWKPGQVIGKIGTLVKPGARPRRKRDRQRDGGVDELEEPQELLVAMTPVMLGDHRSAGDVQGGEQAGRAVPDIVMGHPRRCGWQHRQAGRGPVQGLDLGPLIDRENQGLLGRSRYRPTTSRTLSMNCGSADNFHVCTRWGLSPKARQIREIAAWLIPVAAAIDRVDQCVSSPGPRFFQRLGDDQLDLLIGDLPRHGGPRVITQALQPGHLEPPRHLRTVSRETPS
jgi:hypothetical protein